MKKKVSEQPIRKGLVHRKTTSFEPDEPNNPRSMLAMISELFKSEPGPDEWLQRLEEWSEEIIKEAGFNGGTRSIMFVHLDGSIEYPSMIEDRHCEVGGKVYRLGAYLDEHCHNSREHIASEVGELAIRARIYLAQGGIKMAVITAMRAIDELWRWRLIFNLEDTILLGQRNAENLAQGRTLANRANRKKSEISRETWQAEAEKVWSKNPKLSVLEAARRVRRNLREGSSVETIRKHLCKPGLSKPSHK